MRLLLDVREQLSQKESHYAVSMYSESLPRYPICQEGLSYTSNQAPEPPAQQIDDHLSTQKPIFFLDGLSLIT